MENRGLSAITLLLPIASYQSVNNLRIHFSIIRLAEIQGDVTDVVANGEWERGRGGRQDGRRGREIYYYDYQVIASGCEIKQCKNGLSDSIASIF